jgi:exopolyphosphatase / guanosine-5'-triphosphate,3'-diphosphate pyrophosphatase
MWGLHHGRVPVAVVDVGSNTVRLLVTHGGEQVITLREPVGLGAEVERDGRISAAKLGETESVVAELAAAARAAGAVELEVLITSPGRQAANGDELREVVGRAADAPVRTLSAYEEGRLAFLGALSTTPGLPGRLVAVVDVGGGSAQVAVGTRGAGPSWIRSLDLGSLRLTKRALPGDPPGSKAVAAARVEVERLLENFDPPQPHHALAVGGTARALRRIAGSRLSASRLSDLVALLAETPIAELQRVHDLPPHRARTLTAGAIVFEAIQGRLRSPFKVVRHGLREGALLELEARRAEAA